MNDNKDLKKSIVDGAQEIFSRFGLKKTTMDEIASKINKAKSSVYYYFKSKEEIFEAVIEKEAGIFRIEIHNAIQAHDTPQDKIKHYVLTRMHMFQKLANFYTAFQKEYIDNYSFINKIRKKYDLEEIELIGNILREGVERHELIVKDVELTAFAILTAMKGFEYQWSIEKNLKDIENDLDCLLEILFKGLMAR